MAAMLWQWPEMRDNVSARQALLRGEMAAATPGAYDGIASGFWFPTARAGAVSCMRGCCPSISFDGM
jgi:hypothetical protein